MSTAEKAKELFRKWVSPLGYTDMNIVLAGDVYKVTEDENGKLSARHKSKRQSAPVS